MSNHPQRNWRRRAAEACAVWLASWRWPEAAIGLLTVDQVRDLMQRAFLAGFDAGRKPQKRD